MALVTPTGFDNVFPCFKVLPLVYDDSLSYYEAICKMREKINELLTFVANLESLSNAYTDEQISKLKADLENTITTTANTLDAKITALATKQQNDYNTLDADITDVVNQLNAAIVLLNAKAQIYAEEVKTWCIDYISSQLLDVKVVNYFTGQTVSIQSMFDYLSQLHVTNGLTYAALATRGYTYADMIALCAAGNYTYTDIILNANTIFPQK